MSNLLDKVNSPKDLKELNIKELPELCTDIREFLVDKVSKTGGHLAPNLGVVELTVALHYVFDSPNDSIIFDVGHQTYVHKILTGRKDQFDTLRQLNGISGFPKPSESEHDVFHTGHSSTSISSALGIATANKILGKPNYTVAVIGDGALTGGLAFEGMNNCNVHDTNLIVVLNDNQMSIAQSVGGLSNYLNKIRSNNIYTSGKRDIKRFLIRVPLIGRPIYKLFSWIKKTIKHSFIPSSILFEQFGFTYLGPIDGNDINALTDFLERAKLLNKPVLVHVVTKKGKGYAPAEENPNKFHGVGTFNKETGESTSAKAKNYSLKFGELMCDEASKNSKLVAITAAMPDGVGLCDYKKQYKDRFFDVGIAEGHAVTFAAGLSKAGLIPVFACYSTFLQRAYDEIVHDVALQNLHVIFAIDRAGIVGQDGETHQGLLDESFLSSIPNMILLSPKDGKEFEEMFRFAIKYNGPIAIRYPRGNYTYDLKLLETKSYSNKNNDSKFSNRIIPIESKKAEIISTGKDLTIVAYGKMVKTAIDVASMLKKNNIYADVINARFLKPLDKETIQTSITKTKNVITIEDAYLKGGLATQVQELLARSNNIRSYFFGYPDEFIRHGKTEEIEKLYHLDKFSIYNQTLKMINKANTKKRKSPKAKNQ